MLSWLRGTLVTLLVLTLSACGGWHLRGSQTDNIATELSLSIDGGSPEMRAALYRYASLNRIQTADSGGDIHLQLDSDVYRRRIHSVGVNEQPTEFMLIYDMVVSATFGEQRLFDQANMRRENIFAYNSENPLAGDNEAQILVDEMRNDLARQLILRAIRQVNRSE